MAKSTTRLYRKRKDGQWRLGKDGHFTSEAAHYLAVQEAVANNQRYGSARREQPFKVGTLEFDSFGLLPADGFGRLSSEDY